MNGPMSGKQRREYLKFAAKENRESAKAESEESRKQELHEIKLQEAASKANLALGHKEEEHAAKMAEMGGPLSKGYSIGTIAVEPVTLDIQGAGSKEIQGHARGTGAIGNPLSGKPQLGRQHPVAPSDTVPAMLTPGEAVIPAQAAQDPKNKQKIKQMVQQGRKAQSPLGFSKGTQKVTGLVQTQNMLPIIPTVGPRRSRQGYADGSTGVGYEDTYNAVIAERNKYKPGTDSYEMLNNDLKNLKNPNEVYNRSITDAPAESLTNEAAMKREVGIALAEPRTIETPPVVPVKPVYSNQYNSTLIPNQTTEESARLARAVPPIAQQKSLWAGEPTSGNTQDRYNALTALNPSIPVLPAGQTTPGAATDLNVFNAQKKALQGNKAVPSTQTDMKYVVPIPKNTVEPVDPSSFSPEEKNSILAEFSKGIAPDIQEKVTAINANPDTSPQEKHTEAASFLESIFGPKGIFNARELTRFALVGAGGLLTGGSVNGSLRYAARDALVQSDARHTGEILDERTAAKEAAVEKRDAFKTDMAEKKALEGKLIDQGYSPEAVKKYVYGTQQSNTLGAPTVTLKPTGATPRFVEYTMQDTTTYPLGNITFNNTFSISYFFD